MRRVGAAEFRWSRLVPARFRRGGCLVPGFFCPWTSLDHRISGAADLHEEKIAHPDIGRLRGPADP
jgi:hypothetical protein